MTDLDPEIWNNHTLGAAAPNENLDRLTKQQIEDRAAKFEGREPREVVVDNTYPEWTPPVSERTGTVPSNFQTVRFADEQPADIPVDSGRPEEDAGTVAEAGEVQSAENDESDPAVESEGESAKSDSSEESDSEKW